MNSDPLTHVMADGAPEPGAADVPKKATKPKSGGAARRMREKVVLVCMGLVTAAAAATLYALFDFSVPAAILSGGGVWMALMLLHIQAKKNFEIHLLKAEIAKLEGGRAFVPSDTTYVPAQRLAADKADITLPSGGAARRLGTVSASASQTAGPTLLGLRQTQAGDDTLSGPPVGPTPQPRWEKPQPGTPHNPQDGAKTGAVETALWPGTALSATDPMRDQWAFRPKDAASPPPVARNFSGGEPDSGMPSSLDTDLEIVQRKIKALADEVNAAELEHDRPSGKAMQSPTASVIEKSVGALKQTADSMRERSASKSTARAAPPPATPSQSMPLELMIPATAERIAVSTPDPAAPRTMPDLEMPQLPGLGFATDPPPPLSPRLAEIAAAIARGSMDVFLSPIVALQTHQVSHYEVTVRLRSSKGGYLDGAEQELQLASSDVLALFDTERLKCAAELAGRLDAHNKPGSLLSPVNGPSLTNGEFLDTFARAYEERERISNQLVLTFSQADVELFSASAWQALGNMHAFGFRFAVAQIDHVAMDFAALAKRGFSFLRLDANALINGLPGRERFFGSAELCQLLAGAGMTLVADSIEDEAIRARVFGFGVLFGQGRLFGGARQVKLDTLPPGSSAAA